MTKLGPSDLPLLPGTVTTSSIQTTLCDQAAAGAAERFCSELTTNKASDRPCSPHKIQPVSLPGWSHAAHILSCRSSLSTLHTQLKSTSRQLGKHRTDILQTRQPPLSTYMKIYGTKDPRGGAPPLGAGPAALLHSCTTHALTQRETVAGYFGPRKTSQVTTPHKQLVAAYQMLLPPRCWL